MNLIEGEQPHRPCIALKNQLRGVAAGPWEEVFPSEDESWF